MINFEEELQKYGLNAETYEQVCKDISDKLEGNNDLDWAEIHACLLYTSPSPRDTR